MTHFSDPTGARLITPVTARLLTLVMARLLTLVMVRLLTLVMARRDRAIRGGTALDRMAPSGRPLSGKQTWQR